MEIYDVVEFIVHIVADFLIAIGTICAFVVAVRSYRMTSFQTLFTAMTNMLRMQLANPIINRTEICHNIHLLGADNNNVFNGINNEASIYKNFIEYYRQNADRLNTQSLDGDLSALIWAEFVGGLYNRSEFEQVFKYLYDCVVAIDQSKLSASMKTHYVRLISDMLTTDQLFCYMINLAHFCNGNCSEDSTVKMLKKYDFFRDFFRSPLYESLRRRFGTTFTSCFCK